MTVQNQPMVTIAEMRRRLTKLEFMAMELSCDLDEAVLQSKLEGIKSALEEIPLDETVLIV